MIDPPPLMAGTDQSRRNMWRKMLNYAVHRNVLGAYATYWSAPHTATWTKPLRGSCRVAMVGATPSSCIFEEVRLRHHGGLLAAALPYRKGASHDCSSTTNDGGYAGSESVASHAGIISPTGLAIRTPLRQVAG